MYGATLSSLFVDSVVGGSGACAFGGDGLGDSALAWPVDCECVSDGSGSCTFGGDGLGDGPRKMVC